MQMMRILPPTKFMNIKKVNKDENRIDDMVFSDCESDVVNKHAGVTSLTPKMNPITHHLEGDGSDLLE